MQLYFLENKIIKKNIYLETIKNISKNYENPIEVTLNMFWFPKQQLTYLSIQNQKKFYLKMKKDFFYEETFYAQKQFQQLRKPWQFE